MPGIRAQGNESKERSEVARVSTLEDSVHRAVREFDENQSAGSREVCEVVVVSRFSLLVEIKECERDLRHLVACSQSVDHYV